MPEINNKLETDSYLNKLFENNAVLPNGYVVWNPNCEIPDISPFTKEAMKLFKKEKYIPCKPKNLLYTELIKNYESKETLLTIRNEFIGKIDGNYTRCYYQQISRKNNEAAEKSYK